MRTPAAEDRFQRRRLEATNRMLDLDPEVRVQLAVLVLMILATEMPAIAMFVLDKAEAGQQ